jgi:hypothetical protein
VSKCHVWLLQLPSQKKLTDHVATCTSVLGRIENENFLDRLVAEDEEWILYNNIQRNHSWVERGQSSLPTPAAGLQPENIMCWVGSQGHTLLRAVKSQCNHPGRQVPCHLEYEVGNC